LGEVGKPRFGRSFALSARGFPRGLIDNVTPLASIKIENEDERDWGLKRGRGRKANESELTKYHWIILRKWGD
jgi:hypothetical protein